jgi:uracil-DNA glycosylase
LWLTYYQHIFNPARLKLKMMQKEMPRKYWKNLPEAQFISELTAQSAQRQSIMIEQAPSTPRRRIPVFKDGSAATARAQTALALDQVQRGDKPLTLQALNDAAQRCRDCPIGQHATQAVCGEGPARARVMVVGEQPGDQEDLRGRPLVGPAGQLFDRALAELNWPRADLFITNAVKHFKYEPRGKRRMHKTPSQQEAAACAHWLEGEITLVQPEVVIALGATAAASLLGRHVAVMSERGQWFTRADGLRVLVTLHPAALLRTPPEFQAAAYTAWLKDLREADSLVMAGAA